MTAMALDQGIVDEVGLTILTKDGKAIEYTIRFPREVHLDYRPVHGDHGWPDFLGPVAPPEVIGHDFVLGIVLAESFEGEVTLLEGDA